MCPLCRKFINITDIRSNLYNALLPNNDIKFNDNKFKLNEIVKRKNNLNKIENIFLKKKYFIYS